MARLPRGGLAPPVAVKRDVPRVVRDDAVSVVPVDLAVAVHVGDGQGSFTKGIIAKIGVGQRCRCRIFVQPSAIGCTSYLTNRAYKTVRLAGGARKGESAPQARKMGMKRGFQSFKRACGGGQKNF